MDRMEFFLQYSQLRIEGLPSLNGALPRLVLKGVRDRLRDLYSAWTNRYRQGRPYDKARRTASKPVQTDPMSNAAVKWPLTWMKSAAGAPDCAALPGIPYPFGRHMIICVAEEETL